MAIDTGVDLGRRAKPGRNLIFVSVLLLVVAALRLGPSLVEPGDYLGHALRVTAWISFSYFILAYAARPMRKVLGYGDWLVRHRRYLGLAAAFAHTVHFGYVVQYARTTTEVIEPATYVGGGLAFALFWMLALTSNDASMRWLKRGWKGLHRVGMHYIWFVYALTFSGGVGVHGLSTLFFGLCLLGLLLRLLAWRAGSKEPTSTADSSLG